MRWRYFVRVFQALASDPAESIERVREKLARRRERRTRPSYEPVADAEERLHTYLGLPRECNLQAEFWGTWKLITDEVAARGYALGRGAFAGWDDGDPGLARMAWCLTRHLQPQVVVETGVGRGLTTAIVLRALALNGRGGLWSIDMPPLAERELGAQIGAAVHEADRSRWTLLRGSSRRLMPGLVRDLGAIDLFIHDSMHTGRNVSFELEQVWPALSEGGAALVDDVEQNAAFARFAQANPQAGAFVCRADDDRALFGCLFKPHGQSVARDAARHRLA